MKTIKINPADNVAVAIEPLKKGESIHIDGQNITLNDDVPAGHKILLSDLVEGENVIKYGYPIGHLKENHKQGDWICHEHIQTNLSGLLDYEYQPVDKKELTNPAYEEWFTKEQLTFQGYRRKNGEVGIRNEVWIVPTVGCVNGIVNQLAEKLKQEVNSQLSTLNSPPLSASLLFRTTTVVRSSLMTTRTPARCCATWCCTPMLVLCLWWVWDVKTTNPTSSSNC